LTPNAQIWPRALNSQIGGNAGQAYLIVSDLGTPSGQGLDFINGFTFLYVITANPFFSLTIETDRMTVSYNSQRFYSVYDTTNSQVGLASTSHTDDITN
jgi:hypothetical protein